MERTRRFHVKAVRVGENELDAAQARHARDVLRLQSGAAVELFDDAGTEAPGTLAVSASGVAVIVESVDASSIDPPQLRLTIASAVPKGERADWMIEKLSELGVEMFIPLAAERSVVLPEGAGKLNRWERLAVESAKQCRRAGVMRIAPLSKPDALLSEKDWTRAWVCATEGGATPVSDAADGLWTNDSSPARLTAFIGPEGGWTPREQERFAAAGLTAVRLTTTILRIETAAVALAAVAACLPAGGRRAERPRTPSASQGVSQA